MLDCKKKDIMFTGIQPTGLLTLGNYCGTMCSWKKIQKYYQCFFCIADLHSLTTIKKDYLKNNFSSDILDMVALYLTCGVNPKNSVIFLQSQVYTHSQLYWILSNFVYFGELSRMTQFKKRLSHNNKKINLSLFSYPILMAADILLYYTNFVSIGLDQKQHIELVKKIALRFNSIYGNIFMIPDILIDTMGCKIMALQDPKKKMSKSDTNINNTIFLLDSIDSIRLKIKNALTDSDNPSQIIFNPQKKPGISNLLSIFSCLTNIDISLLEKEFKFYQYSKFKKKLSDIICDTIFKIQQSYMYFRKNEDYLVGILQSGKNIALDISKKNLKKVFNLLHLM
ncbi:Tryptophan--tRNA ligase [Buchnera aphidicola (Cinara piceae)]|uniref:Tryptophan--tRNA ligase n=1 Tax=Buchnera aphidicola (Cinara piceae) TaxID=1660043 RepID=A0A803FUF1_9GAMM|nr:tryptophan--tRNA ligase [Buchnera aphidicola]VFP88755.1 Tryptophan--tRNA ligase [Buchnera aphidicola (Cinara piceae)]